MTTTRTQAFLPHLRPGAHPLSKKLNRVRALKSRKKPFQSGQTMRAQQFQISQNANRTSKNSRSGQRCWTKNLRVRKRRKRIKCENVLRHLATSAKRPVDRAPCHRLHRASSQQQGQLSSRRKRFLWRIFQFQIRPTLLLVMTSYRRQNRRFLHAITSAALSSITQLPPSSSSNAVKLLQNRIVTTKKNHLIRLV